jgi:hypothetical protein
MLLPNGKYLIIDGQHRTIGCQQLFEKEPNAKIRVEFIIFPHVKDMELFADLWEYFNIGKPQRRGDIMKMWEDILTPLKELKADGRFSHSGTNNMIGESLALSAWWGRDNIPHCENAIKGDGLKNDIKNIPEKDIETIKRITDCIEYAFQAKTPENTFYSPAVYRMLFKLYHQNIGTFNEDEIKWAWKRNLLPHVVEINAAKGKLSSDDIKNLARKMLYLSNIGKRANGRRFTLKIEAEPDKKVDEKTKGE